MRWLFRPWLLILLAAALAGGAAALWVLAPRGQEIRAAPLQDNESEIVWLYSATNESSWERFVTAVSQAAQRLRAQYPDLTVSSDENTFPRHTAAHPELALAVRGGSQRLVFRWYRLTSDQNAGQWVAALLNGRRRPPLAIIGGSSSDQAKDIALALKAQVEEHHLTTAPLLLLTSATADRVSVGDKPGDEPLNGLYAGRTFRFCFTNQQMAGAVTQFVASRPELRPDSGPFYVAQWADDAYSLDLTGRFCESLERPGSNGAAPPNPIFETIDFSVGEFDQPNRWEAIAVKWLMEAKLAQFPQQQRPLLVLAAPSSQPARRFLRGLARTAPAEARRFVVLTGDALSFNTIYRDRKDLWPIQDLPFELVFFCHRNPVDPSAGFVPLPEDSHAADSTAPGTGTEDLLLDIDIVDALVQAVSQRAGMPANGDELGERLHQARWFQDRVSFGNAGPPLFDANGHRQSGSGEHIVWLRPAIDADPQAHNARVLPRATIEVYAGHEENGGSWQQLRVLKVDYDGAGDR